MPHSDFTVLFDLDGTLLNTLGDLADAINFAVRTLGFPEKTDAEVLESIGNGLRRAVIKVLPEGQSDATIDAGLALLREQYKKCYMARTYPYPGVLELLNALRERGFRIGILSNKAEEFTSGLVKKHFSGLADAAAGERPGVPLKPAPDAVRAILSEIGGDPGRCVYVGDSEVDIATAGNAGIPCVLVSWGFRSRDVLVNACREAAASFAGADAIPIADDTAEALAALLAVEEVTLITESEKQCPPDRQSLNIYQKSIPGPKKTLYISDLDGTLLDGGARFSDYTLRVIHELISLGENFSVATGRSPASAIKVLEPIRVTAPVIMMNGALVYDTATSKYLRVEGLVPDAAPRVVDVMRRLGVDSFMYSMDGDSLKVYYENLSAAPLRKFHDDRSKAFGKVFTKTASFDEIINACGRIIYFVFRGSKREMIPIYDELIKIPGLEALICEDDYTPDLCFLESYGSGVSKSAAVRYLRELGGFDYVVGFGDNLNDLPLFTECDECYAPENAKDEVKAAATAIIGSNAEDGVARWLSRRLNMTLRV